MPALCSLSELHLPEIRTLLVGAACAGQFVSLLGTGGRLYRWDLPALEAELKKLGLARPRHLCSITGIRFPRL